MKHCDVKGVGLAWYVATAPKDRCEGKRLKGNIQAVPTLGLQDETRGGWFSFPFCTGGDHVLGGSAGTLVVSSRSRLGSVIKPRAQDGSGLLKLEQRLENLVLFSRVKLEHAAIGDRTDRTHAPLESVGWGDIHCLGPCITQDSKLCCAGTCVAPSSLGWEGVLICSVC